MKTPDLPKTPRTPGHAHSHGKKGLSNYSSADAEDLKDAKGVKDLAMFAKDLSAFNRKLLFGKPLSRLPITSLPHPTEKDQTIDVPEFMHNMIMYIRDKGLMKKQGVFRLSGGKIQMDEFRRTFEMGHEKELSERLDKLDPNTVTDLFKYFWRELPETLFPPALFWDLVNAWKENPRNYDKIREIRDHKLPDSRKWVAWYLFDFLCEVATYQKDNMMTPSNIAIVFAPNIIKARPETIQTILETTQAVIELTKFMIEDLFKAYIQRHPECRARLGLQDDEVEDSVIVQTKEADDILQHEPEIFSEDELDHHDDGPPSPMATSGDMKDTASGDMMDSTTGDMKDSTMFPSEE